MTPTAQKLCPAMTKQHQSQASHTRTTVQRTDLDVGKVEDVDVWHGRNVLDRGRFKVLLDDVLQLHSEQTLDLVPGKVGTPRVGDKLQVAFQETRDLQSCL